MLNPVTPVAFTVCSIQLTFAPCTDCTCMPRAVALAVFSIYLRFVILNLLFTGKAEI
jgi:hypothetical protein